MVDRRWIQYIDWGLLSVTALISLIGLVLLYSAVSVDEKTPQLALVYKQLVWYGAGIGLMGFLMAFHYRHLDKWAPLIYVVAILLLAAVHIVGRHAGGSTRWLAFGPFNLQPSEPMKIALIIMLSRYFSGQIQKAGMGIRALLPAMLFTAVPFFLVASQPDLGIAASMALFGKIERRTLLCGIIIAVIAVPIGWQLMAPYQKERVMTLLSPDRDPLGSGYHIRQSKIAVGSGLILGKGYLEGTQKKLSFLPEQHTDFIFSVLAEEWGFVGSIFLLFLFLLLIAFGLSIAHGCRDSFGTLLCAGVCAMIFWQVFINMGMVMGIMPVVGMPLPLISYGGSSVLTIFMGIGLLMNVSMRRFLKK